MGSGEVGKLIEFFEFGSRNAEVGKRKEKRRTEVTEAGELISS
jgi:hypothetical protein